MNLGILRPTLYVGVGLLSISTLILVGACAGQGDLAGPIAPTPVPGESPSMAPLSPAAFQSAPGHLPASSNTSASSPSDTAAPTNVIEYAPHSPAGEGRDGSCWTNSLAVPSRAAWRCSVGNEVLDPCFDLGDGEVACNPNPLTGYPGTRVKLSQPLPQPDLIVDRATSAWMLQLEDGTICNVATGATGMVGDKRISYVCLAANPKETETVVILGDPQPGKVWTAEKAVLTLREGSLVPTASAVVPVQTVVRGPTAFVPFACEPLAQAMGEILGADVTRSEAAFIDPVTGERGVGSQMTGVAAFADPARQPVDVLGKALAVQGWREDTRYRISSFGESATAFRNAGALCLVNAERESVTETDRAAGDLAMAKPPPAEQQLYTVSLNCARDKSIQGEPTCTSPRLERILFEPNATSASLRRPIRGGEIQEYVLQVFADQTMIVEVSSPGSDVFLSATGLNDGAPLVKPSANAHRWWGKVPATQDYVIKVAARGDAAEYSLRVVIPVDLELPSFDGRAGNSVRTTGSVRPNQSMYYLLSGAPGRGIRVTVTSKDDRARLSISDIQRGEPLIPSGPQLETPGPTWIGKLAEDGHCLIEVTSTSSGQPVDYALEVGAQ